MVGLGFDGEGRRWSVCDRFGVVCNGCRGRKGCVLDAWLSCLRTSRSGRVKFWPVSLFALLCGSAAVAYFRRSLLVVESFSRRTTINVREDSCSIRSSLNFSSPLHLPPDGVSSHGISCRHGATFARMPATSTRPTMFLGSAPKINQLPSMGSNNCDVLVCDPEHLRISLCPLIIHAPLSSHRYEIGDKETPKMSVGLLHPMFRKSLASGYIPRRWYSSQELQASVDDFSTLTSTKSSRYPQPRSALQSLQDHNPSPQPSTR